MFVAFDFAIIKGQSPNKLSKVLTLIIYNAINSTIKLIEEKLYVFLFIWLRKKYLKNLTVALLNITMNIPICHILSENKFYHDKVFV